MKNKTFLAVLCLTIAVATIGVVSIVGIKPLLAQIQGQAEVKAGLQGENVPVRVQAEVRAENQGEDMPVQAQAQVQAQVQAGNQEEPVPTLYGQEMEDQDNDTANEQKGKAKGLENAQNRRSEVANAVQEMLAVADRSEGIGEQVRLVAQNQQKNFDEVEAGLEKVQNRNQFVRFLLGPDYQEIKKAKNLLEQSRTRTEELSQLKLQVMDPADQEILDQQLQTMEQVREQVETRLDESQKGFSLLGWMFRLFSR